jgi:hypothetical protein
MNKRESGESMYFDAFGDALAVGDTVELRRSGDLAKVTNLATRATVVVLPGAITDDNGTSGNELVVDYDALALA